MPYNTRRKSLSLPSLGIHLPKSQQHLQVVKGGDQPPQKKIKRDHPHSRAASYSSSSPLVVQYDRLSLALPPSPPPENTATVSVTGSRSNPISHDGINDEIVSGVVDVLERNDNRPHTVKELAAVLSPVLSIVENSANPHAIISSRLNTFLKRGFPASSPCVLAKQLITTHPKRIYFYLTTCPHQPIPRHENDHSPPSPSPAPAPPALVPPRTVISPALSDDDEALYRHRTDLSPSPEVDLSSHDLDHDDNDITGPPSPARSSHSHRPPPLAQKSALSSPPLEGDEREFSQSAIYIGRPPSSSDLSLIPLLAMSPEKRYDVTDASPLLLDAPKRDHHLKPQQMQMHIQMGLGGGDGGDDSIGVGAGGGWGGELERHLASPESVELDELDGLLGF